MNIIFYLIQQLMILPNMSVHALLDFETKEFLSGKVIRAALFHVKFGCYLLTFC